METSENLKAAPSCKQSGIESILYTEIKRRDELRADPKCDHFLIFEQACRIIQLMSRLLGNMDKEYVINTEAELFARMEKLKKTCNTLPVLLMTFASATLTGLGGASKMGAAIPGTTLGQVLGNKAPNALGWISNTDWAKKLGQIGDGLGSVGQATSSLTSLLNNSSEVKREVIRFNIEETKRKRSDREDSARQMRDQASSTANNNRQAIQAIHNAMQNLLSNRG